MKHTSVLAELRPLTPDLDAEWSARTLGAIVDRPATAGRPPLVRLAALVLAAAAVAAVAVVSIPSFDSGDAVAADLRDLSRAAVGQDGPVLGQGTWLHERSESLQRSNPDLSDGAVLDTRRETWTRWDGRVLVIEQRPSQGWTTYNIFDDDNAASYQSPTPEFARTLPDDAEGLIAYLDPLVFGASSHSEALFSALTSLATSHTLPPATLAAAYTALGDIDNVRTSDVSIDGRAAVEITYDEQLTSSTNSITVDRATGQVLATKLNSRQGTYTSTTMMSEVVDTVPADVLRTFRERDEDVRYDVTGQPLD